MKKNYKIIVAHPDDEIIFFSSILRQASKVIICFSETLDKTVNNGRLKLLNKIPFKNFLFLKIKEPNIFNTTNWSFDKKRYGLKKPNKNIKKYKKYCVQLEYKLSNILKFGDTVYTHNPWGEYGHEEHILVFKTIIKLSKKLNLKIFVNGYVSNKSFNLMKLKQHWLSKEFKFKNIDQDLTKKISQIYKSNFCWTFNDDYKWPKKDIFYKINKDFIRSKKKLNIPTTYTLPILNFMTDDYKVTFFKNFLGKIFPYRIKKKLKLLLKKTIII